MKRLVCLVTAALLVVLAVLSASAQDSSIVVFKKKIENPKIIALTFDDGPHPRHTMEILDILRKYDVRATFFVVGEKAGYYPDVLRRIVKEGHEIGNHTFSHKCFKNLTASQMKSEIERCDNLLNEICGYKTKLFRPPEGVLPGSIYRYIKDENYTVILWNIDTRDWAGTPAEAMLKNIKENVSSGDIILMHDYTRRGHTVEALKMIIPYLIDEGYKFVTISELLGYD
ncbi:MAG: polysaccharide deacetylase family protein [Eubacteriales bacterium]|jgi:polysaccharide deacetylase family sporulation protein PdaB